MLLLLITMILGGCAAEKNPGGPAGTSNLVVDLQSLQPSVGGLSPSFHPADTTYTVNVGPNTGTVMLTAVTTDSRANLTINNQPATSGQPFGPITLNGITTNVPIVVEAFGVSKDYQVTVSRVTTPDLQDLKASAGALSPAFDPATLAYTVTTDFGTASTTVTATVADTTATLTINGSPATSGQPSGAIALNPGSTIIPVVVTASNGQKKTYTVTVIRGNTPDLANLQTSAGPIAPVFSPSVVSYTASVVNATTQATITVTLADSTGTVTINRQAALSGQASGPFNLIVGANTFTIVVTAGLAGSKTYTLVINREGPNTNPNLSDLSVSAGPLDPLFAPGTTSYTVDVPNSTTSTTVTATVAVSTSSLTINNNTATSGQPAGPFDLNQGANVFTVIVTSQSGATNMYKVTITRSQPPCAATLTNLTISSGSLVFNPSTPTYTVSVGDTVGSVSVTVTPQAGTSVTINEQGTNSLAVPLNPSGSQTTITVVVQCPGGSTTTYTITVNRATAACNPNLGGLALSAGSLSFDANTTSYTLNVPNSASSTTVTATLPAGSTSTLRINNQAVTSGQTFGPIDLKVGTSTVISIVVQCANGTTNAYTLRVTRQAGDATLKNLEVTTSACNVNNVLQPQYAPNTPTYTASVSTTTSSVCVTATKSDPGQVVTINQQLATVLVVSLGPPGSSTLITVEVTALDGVTKSTYTVTVSRAASNNANLASFSAVSLFGAIISQIDLTQSNTLECARTGTCTYTGTSAADSVRFTATKSDLKATLEIRGPLSPQGFSVLYATAGPGVPTAQATLNFPNTCPTTRTITVRLVVMAQDGVTQRTTTLTITGTCLL